MNCCVYWIRLSNHSDFTKDGYIGISTDLNVRLKDHKSKSKSNNSHLYRAIRKYGWENLVIDTLLVSNVDYCRVIENKLRPSPSIGWNEIPGGDKPPSINPLIAKKISEALKGKPGKPHTEATKLIIAESNRNRVLSEESKQKISDAMKATQLLYAAKKYLVCYPDGHEEIVTNLTLWCLSNGLAAKYMFRVASGERKQYKGYTCKRVTNSCEQEKVIKNQ